MKNHITILGSGNLTKSILDGMEASKMKKNIGLIDTDKTKKIVSKFHKINFSSEYSDSISKSDFIMLRTSVFFLDRWN